uniref:Winged helix domain-containing protein n=1 Tax=OCS116 cluster bacterium TaxID=2030921 RepID=A0A2A4YUG5_9PROT
MARLSRKFIVDYPSGQLELTLTGQPCRTLIALIEYPKGITSGDVSVWGWGYRLSAYVHQLRHEHGLDIAMLKEPHIVPGGKGWHGRYKLITTVKLLGVEGFENDCS